MILCRSPAIGQICAHLTHQSAAHNINVALINEWKNIGKDAQEEGRIYCMVIGHMFCKREGEKNLLSISNNGAGLRVHTTQTNWNIL